MNIFRLSREVLKGVVAGSKKLAYDQTQCYNVCKSLKWSLIPKRNVALQWQNIIWSNPLHSSRRQACNKILHRYAKRFTLVSFISTYLAEQTNTSYKPSLQECAQSFQNSIGQDLGDDSVEEYSYSFDDYKLGKKLGHACNAVVYEADNHGKECAVKAMFNYYAKSSGTAILQAFEREYKTLSSKDILKRHPNIIKLHTHFVGSTPVNEELLLTCPAAIPRMHGGHARNKTLFLVMPKYTCSLQVFLQSNRNRLSHEVRVLLFSQLLEAVAHLERSGVVHRDIKSDNILVNVKDGFDCPQLVLTDFGDCLYNNNMMLSYESEYVHKGGNAALMAPEIISAVAGKNQVINYSKADAWSVGTLAYEIFGFENPFYGQFENTSYNAEKLPKLKSGDKIVDKVVYRMLQCDPELRLTARNAATILFLLVFAPEQWFNVKHAEEEAIHSWLLELSINAKRMRCKQNDLMDLPVEQQLHMVFLTRITFREIRNCLNRVSEMK